MQLREWKSKYGVQASYKQASRALEVRGLREDMDIVLAEAHQLIGNLIAKACLFSFFAYILLCIAISRQCTLYIYLFLHSLFYEFYCTRIIYEYNVFLYEYMYK